VANPEGHAGDAPGHRHTARSKKRSKATTANQVFLTYCIALCLANCYNQKRFLDQNAHKAFGDRGPQREHTALSKLAGFKGEGPFCGRKPKEGQGREVMEGTRGEEGSSPCHQFLDPPLLSWIAVGCLGWLRCPLHDNDERYDHMSVYLGNVDW